LLELHGYIGIVSIAKTLATVTMANCASLYNIDISLWGAALKRSPEKYFHDKHNVNE
jgi:hypothetical protein